MLMYDISGRETVEIENIVFDYNGTTIAVDGKILEGVKDTLLELKNRGRNIYILTADTYGTVERECRDIRCKQY